MNETIKAMTIVMALSTTSVNASYFDMLNSQEKSTYHKLNKVCQKIVDHGSTTSSVKDLIRTSCGIPDKRMQNIDVSDIDNKHDKYEIESKLKTFGNKNYLRVYTSDELVSWFHNKNEIISQYSEYFVVAHVSNNACVYYIGKK